MIRVQHKAGTPWPDLKTILYTIRKCTFARKLKIEIEFDAQIAGAGSTESTCWLKVAGLKSGWETTSNNEQLAAFVVDSATRTIEFCEFMRRGEDLVFRQRYVTSYRKVQRHSIEVKRVRWGAMRWPAWPWAEGCGKVTKQDFSYRMKITRLR